MPYEALSPDSIPFVFYLEGLWKEWSYHWRQQIHEKIVSCGLLIPTQRKSFEGDVLMEELLSLPPFSMHLASGQLFWINVFASLSLCRTCGCLTFKDTKRYLVHKSRPSIRYRETIFKLYSLKRILKMTSLSPYYVIYSNALTTNARECLKGYWRWYHWVDTT